MFNLQNQPWDSNNIDNHSNYLFLQTQMLYFLPYFLSLYYLYFTLFIYTHILYIYTCVFCISIDTYMHLYVCFYSWLWSSVSMTRFWHFACCFTTTLHIIFVEWLNRFQKCNWHQCLQIIIKQNTAIYTIQNIRSHKQFCCCYLETL